MTAPEPVHLTTEGLAERWHTTRDAIYMAKLRGEVPTPFRRGRRLLWPLDAVEAWERDHLVPA